MVSASILAILTHGFTPDRDRAPRTQRRCHSDMGNAKTRDAGRSECHRGLEGLFDPASTSNVEIEVAPLKHN